MATSEQHGQSGRDKLLVIFDAYFGGRDNLVNSYLSFVIAQLPRVKELHCLNKEPYRGAFPQSPGCKVKFYSDRDAAKIKSGKRPGLGRRFKGLFEFEPEAFWASSISGDFEGMARLLFNAESYHAVICFTQSTSLALAVARLAHVFSGEAIPHLFCVTRRHTLPVEDLSDLAWLKMQLLYDGELVPTIEQPARPYDAYLFLRPFSQMSRAMLRQAAGKVFEKVRGRIGFLRRRHVLHSSTFLHLAFEQRMKQAQLLPEDKRSNLRIDESSAWDLADEAVSDEEYAFKLPAGRKQFPPLSFFDDKQFPLRAKRTRDAVDWSALLDPAKSYARRVRNVVLFIRPDWDGSGSGTSFNSFKTYFRRHDSLCIEIAIWPYHVPFSGHDRKVKLLAGEKQGRPAFSFFLRRSGGFAQHLRALFARRRLRPRTLSGELLLYYVGAAAPKLMLDCLANAHFNTIFVNHYFTQEYAARFIKGRKYYLDTHDIQATNAVHQMYRNPFSTRLESFQELFQEEVTYLDWAHRMSFVSPDEVSLVKDVLPAEKVKYFIPLPVIRRPSPARGLSLRPKLVFLASNNLANEQNLRWFLSEVWPKVLEFAQQKDLEDFELQVVGDIKSLFEGVTVPNLIFAGRVESLRTVYDESDLVLLPIVAGGGVAIKTLEALLYHKAIVATRHALRGMPDGLCDKLEPVDDPEDFAKSILKLITDEDSLEARRQLSVKAAERLIDENFYDRLTECLEAVRFS